MTAGDGAGRGEALPQSLMPPRGGIAIAMNNNKRAARQAQRLHIGKLRQSVLSAARPAGGGVVVTEYGLDDLQPWREAVEDRCRTDVTGMRRDIAARDLGLDPLVQMTVGVAQQGNTDFIPS